MGDYNRLFASNYITTTCVRLPMENNDDFDLCSHFRKYVLVVWSKEWPMKRMVERIGCWIDDAINIES